MGKLFDLPSYRKSKTLTDDMTHVRNAIANCLIALDKYKNYVFVLETIKELNERLAETEHYREISSKVLLFKGEYNGQLDITPKEDTGQSPSNS